MRRRLCRARASCTSGCTSCPSRFGSPRWTGWPRCWSSCPRTPPHTTGYIMVEWVRCCDIRNNYSGSGYEVLEFRIRILTMLLKHIWIFFCFISRRINQLSAILYFSPIVKNYGPESRIQNFFLSCLLDPDPEQIIPDPGNSSGSDRIPIHSTGWEIKLSNIFGWNLNLFKIVHHQWKKVFCREKSILSREKIFCREKKVFCREKSILSRKKYFVEQKSIL